MFSPLRDPGWNTSRLTPVALYVVDPLVDLHHFTGRPPRPAPRRLLAPAPGARHVVEVVTRRACHECGELGGGVVDHGELIATPSRRRQRRAAHRGRYRRRVDDHRNLRPDRVAGGVGRHPERRRTVQLSSTSEFAPSSPQRHRTQDCGHALSPAPARLPRGPPPSLHRQWRTVVPRRRSRKGSRLQVLSPITVPRRTIRQPQPQRRALLYREHRMHCRL